VASLEFVLGLPFLMLSAAVAFGLASASVAAIGSAAQARHDAWAARAGLRDGAPFRPSSSPGDDLATRRAVERFPVSLALPLADRSAWSKNAVLAGSWDHHAAPFDDPGTPFTPHVEHLQQLVEGAAAGAPGVLTDLGGLADFAEIGDPGSGSIASSALSGVAGPLGGAGALLSTAGGQGLPLGTLDKIPGAGSPARSLDRNTSSLTSKARGGKLDSLGGVRSLSKSAADAQNAALDVGRTIYEGVDAALDPLEKLTDVLDDVVGGGDKGGGGFIGDVVDEAKKVVEKAIKEVVGLFGGSGAKKKVEELVKRIDQLRALREQGSPFKKLARAARDLEEEDPDEFSALDKGLLDKIK
jgi:hypothetical protein